jgi:LuxR family maltose regulon positive regulatory protein
MLKENLLVRKLHAPQLRAALVLRPHVVDLLEQGARRAMTLISAQAGSGKTTALAAWMRDSRIAASWLALDSYDNDLQRFWTYVLAALDHLRPGMFKEAQELLAVARQPVPIESVLTALLNDLINLEEDVALILDDYHEITAPAIHASVAFLLDHLPARLHLFIVSRSDPPFSLARLRISNQLMEIRSADLRFSQEETALFLNTVMGLYLTDDEIAVLEKRTEGWIAALQLAGLSLQRRPDIPAFIASFTGNHYHLVNYLAEEVLQKQSQQVQRFLLHTSLLERMNAALCQEMTGDAESRAMLTQLEQANLFVVALDDEHAWYRYHQLFADFLHTRLQQSQPDYAHELHERAARWYQRNGYYEEAMSHFLLLQDFAAAAQLIVQNGEELMRRGDFALLDRWILSLPAQLVRSKPDLIIIHARVLAFLGQLQAAEERIEQILSAEWNWPGETVEGEVLVVRAFIATQRMNFPRAVELSRRALAYLPATSVFMRSIISLCLGIALRFKDTTAAHRALAQAIRDANSPHISVLSLEHLGYQLQELGQLHRALEVYQQTLSMLPEEIPSMWMACLGMAEVYREWNRLDEADSFMRRTVQMSLDVSSPAILLDIAVIRAMIAEAQGRTNESIALLRQEEMKGRQKQIATTVGITRAYQALFAVWHGDVEAALPWMRDFEQQTAMYPLNTGSEREYRILARVQLAARKYAEAEAVLAQLLALAQEEGRTRAVIKAMALQALVFQAQSATEQAIKTIMQALVLAEPEEYVRTFTEEGAGMTALLKRVQAAHRTKAVSPRIAPEYLALLLAASVEQETVVNAVLSDREMEILQLISSGLSNQEIADQLIISMNTVKWHVRQIFNKLNANSRTQVLARAKELKLL